jgi:hypothetical protein
MEQNLKSSKAKLKENQLKKTENNDGKAWLFKEGDPGGPGRPKETLEQKITKKATKEFIEDYKEKLAAALPRISPVLIKKAMTGDIPAIKELNDRVMGKAPQNTDLNVTGKLDLSGLLNQIDNGQPESVEQNSEMEKESS